MEIHWPTNIAAARHLQERDKERVRVEPLEGDPLLVAGVDAAFSGNRAFGAICVYRYPELVLIEQASAVTAVRFPYVPGYLLFREGPALVSAFRTLKNRPGLLLVDGHGIAHPLGIGSASHLGIMLDIPTIGCAKTRLVGEFQEPGEQRGGQSVLKYRNGTVGAVLRTRTGVQPVFVSPGHKADIQSAIRIVLGCTVKYRIPEPLRCADMLSRRMRDSGLSIV